MAATYYIALYKALASTGRYHLTASPADAEISMVISTQVVLGPISKEDSLRLEIFDVKTHTLLWTLQEPTSILPSNKKFTVKNVAKSIDALTNDLNNLALGSIPGAQATASKPAAPKPTASKPGPTKTRLSDEGKN